MVAFSARRRRRHVILRPPPRSLRLAVRTPASHAGNGGSIPPGSATICISPGSAPGMMFAVQLPQPQPRHMGVDLRGG